MTGDGAPRRAVIIDPAFLGDVVFDGPLVRALRTEMGISYVGLVVRPPADAIGRAMVGVDVIHVFDKRGGDRGLAGLRRVARTLADHRYDLALVPHPSVRSTLLARLAGIPERRGLATGFFARQFLTDRITRTATDGFVSERLRLVSEALAASSVTRALPGTFRARRREAGGRPRVGMVLGSQWETKRWDLEQAARFVSGLDPRHVRLVLLGASNERPLFDALRARAPGALQDAEDAVGGTVDALVEAIASCDLVVAGDTGPLHMARALGIPVVALFGPTSELRHDFGPRDATLAVELRCRPCSPHGDRVCPEGHHRCMRELAGERVLSAVTTRLLEDRK